MYSKAEMQQLKRDFWIAFSYHSRRKWLLYDTRIKDFSFKFSADNKKAAAMLDIEMKDDGKRHAYFEKLESLRGLLLEDYLADAQFERDLVLENGKTISRIWVEKSLGMANRANWNAIFDFFAQIMDAFERFYSEFGDFIKDV
jgi:hypothetical protein